MFNDQSKKNFESSYFGQEGKTRDDSFSFDQSHWPIVDQSEKMNSHLIERQNKRIRVFIDEKKAFS